MRKDTVQATLTERFLLTDPAVGKRTYHLALRFPGSFPYQVGDCIALHPRHDPQLVESCLERLGASFNETALHPRTGEVRSIGELLTSELTINELPRKLVQEAAKLYPDLAAVDLKNFAKLYSLDQFLKLYPLPKELVLGSLTPLLPRFYSIASSPTLHPEEVHLTVALAEVQGRRGVASHYLTSLLPMGGEVECYLHPHRGFTLPEDPHRPIIMVGPGTGVAPFRAFLQERRGSSAANWLFFGERSREGSYYYRDFFEELKEAGRLKLSLAFSRDQPEKIYVQHRMEEEGSELIRWLENGATFYVCGDMQRMAKDVEEALIRLIAREKHLTPEEARQEVMALRKEGRYLRDVY